MTAPGGDFGDYEIISEIGRGGMGIVYQARDKRDDRIVAIKQLVFSNIDPAKGQEFRDRFKREAATAARLTHANIVTVYDVCVDQQTDNYFYVMEYLDGHNLRRELSCRRIVVCAQPKCGASRRQARQYLYAQRWNGKDYRFRHRPYG
jgi:serine/threonine protein kinase